MIGSFESPFELGILNSSMAWWPTHAAKEGGRLVFSTLRHVKVKRFHGPLSCFQTQKKHIDDDSEDVLSEVKF